MSIVFLNGSYESAETAKISVFDRGFLLGDGVYEVIPAYSGHLFRLDEHLHRLQSSLDAIRLKNPYTLAQWQDMLNALVQKNLDTDLSVYLQVTRGVAVRDHAFPADTQATVFAMVNKITPLSPGYYESGVSAVTLDDNRWSRCNIKAISLLPNVLLRQEAVDQGVMEAILVRDNIVTEGAASNVFAVIDGVITTAPKSEHLLPGITRDVVIEMAEEQGIAHVETDFSLSQLLSADEVWLTSSTKEILPVTQLNDKPVGNGKPGPVWHKMSKIYGSFKAALHST